MITSKNPLPGPGGRCDNAMMTGPKRYLVRMFVFLVIVVAVAGALVVPLESAFSANLALNGLIVGVLVLGIVYVFRQVLLLRPEVAWIETFRRSEPGLSVQAQPKLLGPMATMLGDRSGRVSLSTLSMRSLLDGIGSRLDESRDISRYMIGLLIFLGLLGTFWGSWRPSPRSARPSPRCVSTAATLPRNSIACGAVLRRRSPAWAPPFRRRFSASADR